MGEDGKIFYTMKLVQGVTLREILKRLDARDADTVRKYPLAALLTIFQKICDGVSFAHGRVEPIIHRDLKQENIMVGDYGEVLVMDWGIAEVLQQNGLAAAADPVGGEHRGAGIEKPREEIEDVFLTQAGSVMGTPGYMAPEQASGQAVIADERTDIFALGGILYALLTLEAPGRISAEEMHGYDAARESGHRVSETFHRRVIPRLDQAARSRTLPHLFGRDVPESLVPVVLKAMALRPGERYESVQKLQADVTAYQDGFATSAEQAHAWKWFKLLIARNKTLFGALAAIFAILLTATVVSLRQRKATRNCNMLYAAPASPTTKPRVNASASEHGARGSLCWDASENSGPGTRRRRVTCRERWSLAVAIWTDCLCSASSMRA